MKSFIGLSKAKRERFQIELRKEQNNKIFRKARQRFIKAKQKIVCLDIKDYNIYFRYKRDELLAGIKEKDEDKLVGTLQNLRVLFSIDEEFNTLPIKEFFDSEMFFVIKQLYTHQFFKNHEIIEESMWIISVLSNAGTEYLEFMEENNLMQMIKSCIGLESDQLLDSLITTVSNMIIDSYDFKPIFEEMHIIQDLLEHSAKKIESNIIHESLSLLISNSFIEEPYYSKEIVS